jgi:hypothetical protein
MLFGRGGKAPGEQHGRPCNGKVSQGVHGHATTQKRSPPVVRVPLTPSHPSRSDLPLHISVGRIADVSIRQPTATSVLQHAAPGYRV